MPNRNNSKKTISSIVEDARNRDAAISFRSLLISLVILGIVQIAAITYMIVTR